MKCSITIYGVMKKRIVDPWYKRMALSNKGEELEIDLNINKMDKTLLYKDHEKCKKLYEQNNEINNLVIFGKLELSSDTLKAIGWKSKDGKVLPFNEQSKDVQDKVKDIYRKEIEMMKQSSKNCEKLLIATLFFNERIPYVKFMSEFVSCKQFIPYLELIIEVYQDWKATEYKDSLFIPIFNIIKAQMEYMVDSTQLNKQLINYDRSNEREIDLEDNLEEEEKIKSKEDNFAMCL